MKVDKISIGTYYANMVYPWRFGSAKKPRVYDSHRKVEPISLTVEIYGSDGVSKKLSHDKGNHFDDSI